MHSGVGLPLDAGVNAWIAKYLLMKGEREEEASSYELGVKGLVLGSGFMALYFLSLATDAGLIGVYLVFPLILLGFYVAYPEKLLDKFEKHVLALFYIKYVTFYIQNALFIYAYFNQLDWLVEWTFNICLRINVLEVMLICWVRRGYMYALLGMPLVLWPWFKGAVDPVFIVKLTTIDYYFLSYYTIYLCATLVRHLTVSGIYATFHKLLPWLVPIAYWVSCRTFVGMLLIMALMNRQISYYFRLDNYRVPQGWLGMYCDFFVVIGLGLVMLHWVFNHCL